MPELLRNDADVATSDRIAELERRLGQIEARLGLTPGKAAETQDPPLARIAALEPAWQTEPETEAEDLEVVVGQNWFAKAGVLILTAGLAFLLSLPYGGTSAVAPALAGLALAAAMGWIASLFGISSVALAGWIRGAALGLAYFATLRLFYFGPRPALATDTALGRVVLVLAIGGGLFLALRSKSPGLAVIAFLAGFGGALVGGGSWFVLVTTTALVVIASRVTHRLAWAWLPVLVAPLAHMTYLLWALGNPLRDGVRIAMEPAIAPAFLLANACILAVAMLLRVQRRQEEDAVANAAAFVNCGFGYPIFLLHAYAALPAYLAAVNGAAFVLLLGVAGLFWRTTRSRVATFVYAMSGYAALTVTILKLAPTPDVFVWLSLQSVVVVATAIWFRSRFIVVANFAIYVAIVLAYVLLARSESGISIGFGIVALVSARILNWQRQRLELKTELMRNAYLLSAFLVFPYALYHLLPGRSVALGWVALAVGYYTLNFIVRNEKYRWMGHATLLLTTLYLVVIGTSRFEPVYRVVSFLVLGTVLLLVSVAFTRVRRRQQQARST